jgi:hypothetical protein
VKNYRRRCGHLPLIQDLREHFPEDFSNSLRMVSSSFDILLRKVEPKIRSQDTIMRKCISAEERLTATLRFLATRRSFKDLKFSTGISAPSLSRLIPETCKAIYDVLKTEYMKVGNRDDCSCNSISLSVMSSVCNSILRNGESKSLDVVRVMKV